VGQVFNLPGKERRSPDRRPGSIRRLGSRRSLSGFAVKMWGNFSSCPFGLVGKLKTYPTLHKCGGDGIGQAFAAWGEDEMAIPAGDQA
jgi:hypothetical protein